MFTHLEDQRFLKLVRLVINIEGGYSNNPKDRGGPTQFGVAWNFHGDWLKQRYGLTDIRQLTMPQARQLYYEKFWLNYNCHEIPDLALAYLHFDSSVQHSSTCNKLLAKVPYTPKYYTANGSNLKVWQENFDIYVATRIRYYTSLSNSQWAEFGEGWMNRMAGVIENASKLRLGIL